MPQGFSRLNGLEHVDGVALQSDAQITGGRMYLNIPNRSLDVIPADDGSGAVVHMSVPLPAGVSLTGSWVETTHGWKRDMDNGWLYRLLNLQSIKVPQALSGYTANGAMFVFDKIPVSDVVNDGDGYWRPKDLQFDITNGQYSDFVAAIQKPLLEIFTQQEIDDQGIVRPDHLVGGIVLSHRHKKNNAGHRKYMNSKFMEIPAPLLVAWDENDQYLGHFFGTYENAGGGRFPKAYHIQDALAAIGPLQDIAYLSISADLGYTTNPGSTASNTVGANVQRASGYYTLDGTFDVESMHWYADVAEKNNGWLGALYEGSTTAATNLVEEVANGVLTTATGSGFDFMSIDFPASTSVSFDGAKLYWLAFGTEESTASGGFDTGITDTYSRRVALGFASQWTDPLTVQTTEYDDLQYGIFLTYSVAVAAPVTTNAALSDSTPVQGDVTTITADVDADTDVVDAEFYIGASDPGEGAGTHMTLTPASGTSVVASFAYNTTPLSPDTYDVNVRGFSLAGGWGAVDTVVMTVLSEEPAAGGGALGSSFKKFLQ